MGQGEKRGVANELEIEREKNRMSGRKGEEWPRRKVIKRTMN